MRKPELVEAARIAPLPVLPVFFRLAGRTALIAGGGEDAAWKAELLLASGAFLRIAAEASCAAHFRFAQNHERAIFLSRTWHEEDFTDCALAIGGFDVEEDARDFATSARRAGVPVNVIDRPVFCDFQFGSIVNRAPVVVSISTDGAAPALGQAIRERIEMLLPASLSHWAQVAKAIRAEVASRIATGRERLAFWRRFAEMAFTRPAADAATFLDNAQVEQKAGKVTIVGAGPGAADYLTLKAVRALQCAEIILFDDLVSDEVLDFARREAKRMTVGKRGGRASCRQGDINALMLKLAKEGKHVVRLKSGDPMIFGRAGEEISALEAAGVDVEVVPGITAALAAASRLKVSLTHRDHAQGLKFITGHARDGALPDIDWRAAADPSVTLMVYMGARLAGDLAARLIGEGLPAATPAAVAIAVGRRAERFERLALGDLLTRSLRPDEPVLIGIGSVFALAAKNCETAPEPAHHYA